MRGWLAPAILFLCLGLAREAWAAPAGLLGTIEVRAEPGLTLPQWELVQRGIAAEMAVYDACSRHGRCPSEEVLEWLTFLHSIARSPPAEQLHAVNAFINRWPYRTDRAAYGERDHWATPLEFLARSGDCEDYAIAKYVSLRRLGTAADDLRLVVVKDTVRDLAHAVLMARIGDQWYVLDNLSDQVQPQERVRYYAPYYSVNETGRWRDRPITAFVDAGQRLGTTMPSAATDRLDRDRRR